MLNHAVHLNPSAHFLPGGQRRVPWFALLYLSTGWSCLLLPIFLALAVLLPFLDQLTLQLLLPSCMFLLVFCLSWSKSTSSHFTHFGSHVLLCPALHCFPRSFCPGVLFSQLSGHHLQPTSSCSGSPSCLSSCSTFISTVGALSRPSNGDNHPIHPSIPSIPLIGLIVLNHAMLS